MTPAPDDGVPTIWSLAAPFTKKGVPVMGSFGTDVRSVIVMEFSTWARLCREHPTLAKAAFNVGAVEVDNART